MNAESVAAQSQHRVFGQGLSGFLLAILVHDVTGLLTAAVLWPLNPLAGIIGGFGAGIGACVVTYDVVRAPAVRFGMRTYFWLIFVLLAIAIGTITYLLS